MFGIYQGQCPPQDETDVCYVKDDENSGVSVFVEDPFPIHASNNVYCSYEVEWENEIIDEGDFSDYVNITFRGDSEHELTIECRDALGNNLEDVEVFLVDSEPPITTKEYGTPYYNYYNNHESEWITSNTTINLTAWDEKIGVNETRYRVTLVDDEDCEEIECEVEGEGSYLTYSNPFTINEESCHLIEFYSTDLFGNEERYKRQCAYVDNSSPNGTKIVGEPNVPGEGSICLSNQSNGGGNGGGGGGNSPGTYVTTVNFNTPCSSGVGVGIAYDGANLWYSCGLGGSSPDLFRANPATGIVSASYDIVLGSEGLGALAYDASRNAIWAGWDDSSGEVRLIHLDGAKNVVTTTSEFIAPQAVYFSLDDGLAYDALDDTLYISGDVAPTIHHYETDGTYLGSFAKAPGSSCGNSGLAIGGSLLYEGFNGCNQVIVVNKSSTSIPVFSFSTVVGPDPGFRDEDLECDTNTFSGSGKHVMWSVEAYEPRRAIAFEIPFGSCGIGGRRSNTTIECENETGINWYVNQSTPITLSCEDQLPHPVNNEIVNWRFSFHII